MLNELYIKFKLLISIDYYYYRGSVPPGARFDPIGPFGSLPGRPSGNRPGRRDPRGPHSGEPDNDELQPPVS